MDTIIIETTSDFLDYIDDISINKSFYQYNLWFRAESNQYQATQLIPNIYRDYFIPPKTEDNFRQRERNLIANFQNEAYQQLAKHQLTNHDVGTYFLMQHYGMHTRLLDWTENALISLFFAVENEHSKHDSVVWILDAYKLNQYTAQLAEDDEMIMPFIYTALRREIRVETYFSDSTLNGTDPASKYPISVKPFYIDERIRNQSACFTLFGSEKDGLRTHPNRDEFLQKVLIPANRLRKIKLELYRIGISYDSIYPGLEGISKKIMYASSVGAC